jgi:hypothetical protein
MLPLELTWSTVQPTTSKWMVKHSEWIKFWKICLEPAWSKIKAVGSRICHGLHFHTIIAIKRGSRWHRTLLNWIELGEKAIFGPDLIDEAEATVRLIQDNLKAMRSHQESYVNKRRRPFEFEVGDHVYLRVSLMKGVKRFGTEGKLAPHYIGPFPIL